MTRNDMSGVHGPSWSDVRMMMNEVGAANNVRIDIHCCGAEGANRAEMLVWNVRAWKWGAWTEGVPLAFESGLYPSSMYVSVPAMLYGLLARLDTKLTRAQDEIHSARQKRMFGTDK